MTTGASGGGARRGRRVDTESAQRAAREHLRQAHATPLYDLAAEPWIPVLAAAGHTERLSLRQLLECAHQIRDLADPHPLARAGMRRFLQGVVVDLVRRRGSNRDQWRAWYEANTGFGTDAVAATLQAHRDHLWLWHPRSPFLQDLRLIDALVTPAEERRPVHELVPELPNRYSSTWFVKPGDRIVSAPLPAAAVARWLVARWFYGLPGNCGAITAAGGATVTSQGGGTFTKSLATLTHAWRVDDDSLFRTLLRNIPRGAIAGDRDLGCAWLDLGRPATAAEPAPPDPLYLATSTATATLLATRDENGSVTEIVRGAMPCAPSLPKIMRDTAVQADPHQIRVQPLPTAPRRTRARVVEITPAQRSEILYQAYRDGMDAIVLAGVVNSADLWLARVSRKNADREMVELFVGTKEGMGASPVWDDIATVLLPARYFDAQYPHIAVVRSVVAEAFDPERGVHPRLERATRILMSPAKPDSGAVQGLVAAVQQQWLTAAGDLLRDALDRTMPIDDDSRARLWRTARTVFAETFAPYLTSTRYAAPYARARSQLRMPRRTQ